MQEFKENLFLVLGLLIIFTVFNNFQQPQNSPGLDQNETEKNAQMIPEQQTQPETRTDQALWIPKLDIWVPIIYVASNDEAQIQTALINGVVHYAGTAVPGEIGNAYVVGHSSNYSWVVSKYNAVFALLPETQIGDDIFIVDYSGQTNFRVIATSVVSPNDLSALSQATNGRRLLTLQTSYPVGEAKQRFLVIAELKR